MRLTRRARGPSGRREPEAPRGRAASTGHLGFPRGGAGIRAAPAPRPERPRATTEEFREAGRHAPCSPSRVMNRAHAAHALAAAALLALLGPGPALADPAEEREAVNFLGFTFVSGKSRRGGFQLQRKTRADRLRAALREVKDELVKRMHVPIPEQGRWLRMVVAGYFAYHAVPTNFQALAAFRQHVVDLWRRTLRRRSQKDRTTWQRIDMIAQDWLPLPRILHPWPSRRFAVKHPR